MAPTNSRSCTGSSVHEVRSASGRKCSQSPEGITSRLLSLMHDTHGTIRSAQVAVNVARYSAAPRCDTDCPCACHKRLFLRSPKLLEQLVGRLFLGYTCLPFLKQPCTSVTCHQRSVASASMTYFLPRWFSEKAVSATFMSTPLGNPSLNLKIRRVVPEMSQLFRLSRYGDAQGLRDLFVSGMASPDDVHIRGGWSALHVNTRLLPLAALRC